MNEMKKMLWLCLTLIIFSGLTGADSPLDVGIKRLGERVLVLNINEDKGGNNVVAIKSKAGIVVVDTTVSPAFSAEIRQCIGSEFGRSDFIFFINTHDHGDHTWGNQTFADCLGIAHESCRERLSDTEKLRTTCNAWRGRLDKLISSRQQRLNHLPEGSADASALSKQIDYYRRLNEGLKVFQPTPPSLCFKERLTLDLGDLTLRLSYYGPSHSDNDILVYCPEEGILLTGDLFVQGMDPHLDSDRVKHLPRWIENLEWIASNQENITTVIPGHGDFLTVADLMKKLTFLKREHRDLRGKKSAYRVFEQVRVESGLDEAIAAYRRLKRRKSGKYYFFEGELIGLGYTLLREERVAESIKVFRLSVEMFPGSFNTYDSLAEAYAANGDIEPAIENYQKSFRLNPQNKGALGKIEKLKTRK